MNYLQKFQDKIDGLELKLEEILSKNNKKPEIIQIYNNDNSDDKISNTFIESSNIKIELNEK